MLEERGFTLNQELVVPISTNVAASHDAANLCVALQLLASTTTKQKVSFGLGVASPKQQRGFGWTQKKHN